MNTISIVVDRELKKYKYIRDKFNNSYTVNELIDIDNKIDNFINDIDINLKGLLKGEYKLDIGGITQDKITITDIVHNETLSDYEYLYFKGVNNKLYPVNKFLNRIVKG